MKKLFILLCASALIFPCFALGQTRTRTRTYTIHHRGGTQTVTHYSQTHRHTNNGRRVHGAYAHWYRTPAYATGIGTRAWRQRHRTGQSSTLRRTYLLRSRDYDHDGDYDARDQWYARHDYDHDGDYDTRDRWYSSHDYDHDGDYDRDDRDRDHRKAKKHGPKSMGRHDNGLHLGQRKHGRGG